jgi:hypothetical protein
MKRVLEWRRFLIYFPGFLYIYQSYKRSKASFARGGYLMIDSCGGEIFESSATQ